MAVFLARYPVEINEFLMSLHPDIVDALVRAGATPEIIAAACRAAYEIEQAERGLRQGYRGPLLELEGRSCFYCGIAEGPYHFDHVIPTSRGGQNIESNVVVACAACNLSKGAKTLDEWKGRR